MEIIKAEVLELWPELEWIEDEDCDRKLPGSGKAP